jgi:hypothetical protein
MNCKCGYEQQVLPRLHTRAPEPLPFFQRSRDHVVAYDAKAKNARELMQTIRTVLAAGRITPHA